MLICKHCGSERKNQNSLVNHERLCASNPDRVLPKIDYLKRKTSNASLKGTYQPYSQETLDRIKQYKKEYWTPERRLEASIKAKERMKRVVEEHPDSYSYKNFCGRSKKTVYRGELMHSSWELQVAKWFDANGISWTRKVCGFKYKWDGVTKTYFPDFFLEDLNLYVEVKGYETDRDRAKWDSVPNLLIIRLKEIKEIQENKFSIRG